MAIPIEDAVSACLNEMRKYYNCESSVENIYKQCFSKIIKFYHKNNYIYYDKKLLEQIIIEREKNLKSKSHNKTFRLRVNKLIEFTETGKINYKIKFPLRYVPKIAENIKLSQEILEFYKGYKAKSLRAIVRSFFCFIEEKNFSIKNISDEIYLDFFEYRKKLNPGTPYFTKKALILISNYLNSNNIIKTKLDFTKMKIIQSHCAIIKPYSKDEIRRMTNILDKVKNVRDKTMIIIALSMGLRFSDIANLKLTDIDWEKKVINIRQKKTGTPLSLPLNITVQNEIAKYLLEERPDCDAEEVFITKVPPFKKLTGSPKCFEYYCKIADIEKIKKRSFHSLRRTFASSLSEEQVPLPTISQLLGHKNSDYDRPYLSYDKEKMQLCSLALDEIPFNTKESLFIGEIKE